VLTKTGHRYGYRDRGRARGSMLLNHSVNASIIKGQSLRWQRSLHHVTLRQASVRDRWMVPPPSMSGT
jgi:hypothetical protein